MNGISFQKTVSKPYLTDWTLNLWEALLLLGSGVTTVILHRTFDMSLGLPGHHGIEWMALLIIGRMVSRFRGAGTLSSIGASLASTVPLLQGGNPFGWFFYLLPGILVDVAFRYLSQIANHPAVLVALAGMAHLTKPIAQWIINWITGWPFGSFRFGILYPFVGHLFFGMLGGLLGTLVVLGIRRSSQKSS